jgi:hypothetical protein
MNVEIGIEAAQ